MEIHISDDGPEASEPQDHRHSCVIGESLTPSVFGLVRSKLTLLKVWLSSAVPATSGQRTSSPRRVSTAYQHPSVRVTKTDLISILNDLTDDEFENFKGHLRCEALDNFSPIKMDLLLKTARQHAVDLMV
ncbi:NACHT, LRR and PYD domains-containing protein 1-like protein [Lates japonicus]|uniref:NACHT, LRR and PYD domains-containing protein 1-like protein n=1 Tax=Lates japonicus TaxID=270547 RepID=A0AAD3NBZ2_LATJO|nr:NACHT, LRR and PYD domains-containing protein 1-like protein [Lates japonicus]